MVAAPAVNQRAVIERERGNLVVAKPTADESVDPRSSGTSARRLDECPASDEMPCAVA